MDQSAPKVGPASAPAPNPSSNAKPAPDPAPKTKSASPAHPGLSLIDVAVGAGSLAVRTGAPALRAVGWLGGEVYSRTRQAVAPAVDPVLDLALWATETLAEVGSLERARAKAGVHALIEAATTAVAADPGVQGMVRDLADSQLDPLVERALPIVLGRLNENPEAVRRIVQDQSSGIMAEAAESARHTARHADDVVDSLTHRLFRRGARSPDTSPLNHDPSVIMPESKPEPDPEPEPGIVPGPTYAPGPTLAPAPDYVDDYEQ